MAAIKIQTASNQLFGSFSGRYFAWVLILYPILVMYSVAGISLAYGSLALGLSFYCLEQTTQYTPIRINTGMLVFFCYMAIIPPIVFLFSNNWQSSIVQTGTWVFLLLFIMITNKVDMEYVWKIYFYVLGVAIAFFLLQEFLWYQTGTRIPGVIPFLDFSYYQEGGTQELMEFQEKTNRSCSFFMEPAVFAKFLMPAIVYNMRYEKSAIRNLIGLSIIILLLRSGVGFLLWGFCCIVYVCRLPIRNLFLKVTIVGSLFAAIIGIAGLVVTTEYGTAQFARVNEFDTDGAGQTSGFYRVIRGYLLFDGMSDLDKIFGVGTKNLGLAIQQSPYSIFFDGPDDLYLNGIQAVLAGGGILGLLLFLQMLYKIGKTLTFCGKMLVWVFFVESFFGAEYLGATMLLTLGIGYVNKKKIFNEYEL